MLLRAAEQILKFPVLKVGDSTFARFEIHSAIISAVNEFNRRTHAVLETIEVDIPSGASSVAIPVEQGDLIRASISGVRVGEAPYGSVLRYNTAGLSGRPTMLAYQDDYNNILLDRAADQAYVLTITSVALANFTPGSRGAYSTSISYEMNDAVKSAGLAYRSLTGTSNLNKTPASETAYWESLDMSAPPVVEPTAWEIPLPVSEANDVLYHGGRAYLLNGYPNHPEAPRAREMFDKVLNEGEAKYRGTKQDEASTAKNRKG